VLNGEVAVPVMVMMIRLTMRRSIMAGVHAPVAAAGEGLVGDRSDGSHRGRDDCVVAVITRLTLPPILNDISFAYPDNRVCVVRHHVQISHPGALSLSPKIARTADLAIAREIFGRRLPPMHSRRRHEKPAGQRSYTPPGRRTVPTDALPYWSRRLSPACRQPVRSTIRRPYPGFPVDRSARLCQDNRIAQKRGRGVGWRNG
jgi:hypothetical protein